MKNQLKTIAFVLSSFLISSCIYESMVPIDKPSVKIDPALLGTWKAEDKNYFSQQYGSVNAITLSKKDEYNYSIQVSYKDKSPTIMFGFLADVNGVIFLNVWDNIPEGSPAGYNFLKLKIVNDSKIELYPLTENIKEQFNSSKELKLFISENMGNSYFFDAPYAFTRIR